MPFEVTLDGTRRRTCVRFHGFVTGSDILVATDELVAHPAYDASFDQLWSLADALSVVISLEEMEALVAHDQTFVESGVMGAVRVGIVVTNALHEAAIRFYQHEMRSSGQEVRLFASEREAAAWLEAARPPAGKAMGARFAA
jgi:hypothetical protein